jgi:uncharacterized protein YukE
MASMTRTDTLNLQADIALETAIDTLTALQFNWNGPSGTEFHRNMTRKEALRYLIRRLMLKDRNNKLRRVAANEPGVPQS